jgi:hypothetical protein
VLDAPGSCALSALPPRGIARIGREDLSRPAAAQVARRRPARGGGRAADGSGRTQGGGAAGDGRRSRRKAAGAGRRAAGARAASAGRRAAGRAAGAGRRAAAPGSGGRGAAGGGRRAAGAGRRAAGGGGGRRRRRGGGGGRPPPNAAECRHELGCPPRRALASRVGRAQRTRVPLASRPASRVSRLSARDLGPAWQLAQSGGWRLAAGEPQGLPHQGPHGPPHQGPHGPPHQGPHGPPHQRPHGPPHQGHTGRRISGPIGRRIRGHTTGRTSSRRSRAMPRGRTCRPSGTALVDRQRRIGCRMRMWPKAWPHRHVASPPMPGPHDDVALPRAVWLQGCAMERLQRRNDRASARLRGWRAISYELSNARARECSPPPRKLDVRASPPERPSHGRRLLRGGHIVV